MTAPLIAYLRFWHLEVEAICESIAFIVMLMCKGTHYSPLYTKMESKAIYICEGILNS